MTRRRTVLSTLVLAMLLTLIPAHMAAADPNEPGPIDQSIAPLVPPTAPTTTTAPITSTTGSTGSSDSSPGFFDIGGRVRQAIDDWFAGLVTSAINPVLTLVGKTLLSAPDVTQQESVQQIWFISIGVANTAFVLLAVVGGVLVMTHDTVQSRYSAKDVAPRLLLAAVAANASLLVCGQAIQLANALAGSFLGDGLDPTSVANGLGRAIALSAGSGGFLVLLALVATVMCTVLACLFIARAAIVVLLAVSGPVALACHALPQTEGLAMLWWRSVAACLGIQVAQALVLITALRVFFASGSSALFGLDPTDSLVSLLVTVCLFWIMLRIPTWAGQMVFGPRGGPARSVKQKVVFAAKTALLAAL